MARAPADGPALVLGPLLRFVGTDSATVWVETDRPCAVTVRAGAARVTEPTWSVHGHHYALVVLTALPPAAELPYEVELGGRRVWPLPGGPFPPSVIRTLRPDGRLRLSFGSCRRSAGGGAADQRRLGGDALAALAHQMVTAPHTAWPDALLLAGDQVYADDPSPALKARLRAARRRPDPATGAGAVRGRRVPGPPLRAEVRNFEEYTWLYHESWRSPAVRWLLSTVPSSMILDDHDLRDDWNTSLAWRRRMSRQPWWRDRVCGAFASYWVYQHLGNLSPAELGTDPVLAAVRAARSDAERAAVLDEMAWRADADPASIRWSFTRELGTAGAGIRLVVVDSRCARRLDPDDRAMLDAAEWQWVRDAVLARPVNHLLLGTTVPLLLPPGIHHLEGWSEAVTGGAWGPVPAWLGERLRRAVDLEHWAAFRRSFHDVVELLTEVVQGDHPPASVLVLAGDIHSSYTARARLTGAAHPGTVIHQLTMSPFRNPMNLAVRAAHEALERAPVARLWHRLARAAGVADVPLRWRVDHGPWFANGVMTIVLDGRRASVEVDQADVTGRAVRLRRAATVPLTDG